MTFDISFSARLLTFHANYQVEDRAGSQVSKISMVFDMSYNRIIIFHVSKIPMTFDISLSTGLLKFHVNYQVEDRVMSRVPKMSMTLDMFYNRIHHILYL